MERKLLNRIKVVLAEKNKSNKWLSEQLDKRSSYNFQMGYKYDTT